MTHLVVYIIVYTILTAWYFYNSGYNAAVDDVKETGRIPELED